MTKTVAIIQARIRSQRLPGKVLFELAGRPMIGLTIARARRCSTIDQVIVATGEGEENDALADVVESLSCTIFRGPEDDVLQRYASAAAVNDADVIVRLTGDCPLIDPAVIDLVVEKRSADSLDYSTNVHPPTWPDGLDVSVFTRKTLERANIEARLPSQREHVVPWMWAQSNLEGGSLLSAANVPCHQDFSQERWTVDDAADFRMVRRVAKRLGPEGMVNASWDEVRAALAEDGTIAAINADGVRDAGLAKSRVDDVTAAT